MPNEAIQNKPSRMQRRSNATKARLLAATLKLVTKKGVDKTTMDDISATADLGRRTLYYHYSSKEDCIVAAVTEVYRQHALALEGMAEPRQDAVYTVAFSTQSIVAALLSEPVTAMLANHPKLLAAAIYQGVQESAYKDIQAGVEQNRFKPPARANMLDNMMIWAMTGLILHLIENDSDRPGEVRDYTHMYLLTLGVDYDEAHTIATEAGKNIHW